MRYRSRRNSSIKQVASGRFGVTPEYLAFAEELQIKIAQGSKPGEGGQLPGHKVTVEIARLRHTARSRADLAAAAPRHLLDRGPGAADLRPPTGEPAGKDLRQARFFGGCRSRRRRVRQGTRGHRSHRRRGRWHRREPALIHQERGCSLGDRSQRSAADARRRGAPGPGAPAGRRRHEDGARRPRRGAARCGRVLVRDGAPPRGGLPDGADVPSRHLSVGIATQRPELRAKFAATPQMVASYLLYVAEEVRHGLGALGLRSLGEAVGRVDLLRPRESRDHPADTLDLAPLLTRPEGGISLCGRGSARGRGELGERLAADAATIAGETRCSRSATPSGTATGRWARVSAESWVASSAPSRRRGAHASFEGVAGQSFGAFLASGVRLTLTGEANDYVGKGMSGGRIVIRPPADDAGEPVLVGNTALYGATGGALFCAGRAGERFAVRNSGAVAVVEVRATTRAST